MDVGWKVNVFVYLYLVTCIIKGSFLGWLRQQRICLQRRISRFDPWVRNIPWRREWPHTPVFFPGESHEQRSLAGYSPWVCKESDRTEGLSTHTHIHN